jgi:hypothetical protein
VALGEDALGSELDAALSSRPWSVSGLLYDLAAAFDDEGRPLGERRAPSAAKKNVPLELVPCPYDDERRGLPMNSSALEQIERHFSAALGRVAQFHELRRIAEADEPERPDEPQWQGVLETVLDSLSGPAQFLLEAREASRRVPAALAVGHKLAAGYFGVVRQLLVEQALGTRRPVSVDALLSFVRERRLLMGDREVCAGPPKLIARATQVLLHGGDRPPPSGGSSMRNSRVALAKGLARQMGLGIAWELFDRCAEVDWLDTFAEHRLRPRTAFLQERINVRRAELRDALPEATFEAAVRAVPQSLGAARRDVLTRVFGAYASGVAGGGDGDEEPLCQLLLKLEPTASRGFEPSYASARGRLCSTLVPYLRAYRELVGAQYELEAALRRALDYSSEVPLRLGGWLLPASRTLGWFQMALGRTVECSPGSPARLFVCHGEERLELPD